MGTELTGHPERKQRIVRGLRWENGRADSATRRVFRFLAAAILGKLITLTALRLVRYDQPGLLL